MIGSYAFSLQGASHIRRGTPCQDASAVVALPCGLHAAAVADGLGSAPRSDEGSALAVRAVASTLEEELRGRDRFDFAEAPALLGCAFSAALEALNAAAKAAGEPLPSFDTTLTACLYDGFNLAYGQVGDGGAVALCVDGLYRSVTAAQKGDAVNQTVPLRGRDWWRFGVFEHQVAAVALMTDGIYDVAHPSVLADQDQPLYIGFIRPFLDNNLMRLQTPDDFEAMGERAKAFIGGLPGNQVSDDKTVAVLMNSDVLPPVQPDTYYAIPDFKALHEERARKLYGGLFGKEQPAGEAQGKPAAAEGREIPTAEDGQPEPDGGRQ